MIRSLRSREKMSNARSPRGRLLDHHRDQSHRASPMPCSSVYLRRSRAAILFDEEIERLALARGVCADALQVAALLQHRRTAGAGRWLAWAMPLDLGVHVGVAGARAPSFSRDGLDQERALAPPSRRPAAAPRAASCSPTAPGPDPRPCRRMCSRACSIWCPTCRSTRASGTSKAWPASTASSTASSSARRLSASRRRLRGPCAPRRAARRASRTCRPRSWRSRRRGRAAPSPSPR